ncbi:geranylgeranyl reductase family protein [uncultured Desulfobacter sp.]|uniref:geranylgeranyl reductase family protein n=1 Tax=uncultured Desulfobacter sp. TaxID=240139 RepID=UPI002AA7D4EA|nr:geranylgeranyl reductase family protein [uncultured Desulfobacter sp.]
MYDVIIVGAGPAGTTAGYLLGRSGFSVLVLDRKNFPRKKACAGGITPKAIELFPFDISGLVRRVCREVKIVRPGRSFFVVKAKTPLCYITKRMELDAYSLGKAVQAGCCFKKIDKIIRLDQDDQGVSLTLSCEGKTDFIRAGYLIGADGANSKIRRLIGGQKSCIVKLPALEADVPVKNAEFYKMTFDFSRDINGYYWSFPRKNHVNIGMFSARPNGTMNRALLKKYAREQFGTDILTDVKGYPIATSSGRMHIGAGRVLLTGDAAGLAEPLLGEGIYSALKSGILSARAIKYAAGQHVPASFEAFHRYRQSLGGMSLDLRLYRLCASILYTFPRWSLAVGSSNVLHNRFSRGYAGGKTLHEILIPF